MGNYLSSYGDMLDRLISSCKRAVQEFPDRIPGHASLALPEEQSRAQQRELVVEESLIYHAYLGCRLR